MILYNIEITDQEYSAMLFGLPVSYNKTHLLSHSHYDMYLVKTDVKLYTIL